MEPYDIYPIATLILLFGVGPAAIFTVLYRGEKGRKKEAQAMENFHITVNNALIDLYRDGHIKESSSSLEPSGQTPIVLLKKDKPSHHLQRAIIKEAYPEGASEISAKDFHVSLHAGRNKLRHLAISTDAIPEKYSETDIPARRLARGEAGTKGQQVLPFIFLGSSEGSTHAGNRNYDGDSGYAGSADFGCDSSGGDSGGGDGGGGGGD